MKNLLFLFILSVSLSSSVAENERSVVKHVFFDINSIEPLAESKAEMDSWTEGLKEGNVESISITGFSWAFPKPESTQAFALLRAYVVKDYLEVKGISLEGIELNYQDASTLSCDEIPEEIETRGWAEVHMSFVNKVPSALRRK